MADAPMPLAAPSNPANPRTFEISLCMTGASSAGAYTAGVIDFLIEALEEWEARRGQPEVPDHRVVLRGFSGASAGGITGALAVVALAGKRRRKGGAVAYVPDLYEAWVEKPDLLGSVKGVPGLLATDDLENRPKGAPLVSLLNGRGLDEICKGVFPAPAAKDGW